MADPERKRLFLSYGRADASELADKLALDLQNHVLPGFDRYEAWKDRGEIKAGRPWSDQIAEALREVAGVVAVLTPSAVRTRAVAPDANDSVCLDEIAYARFAAQKPIVPAMAIACEPPFEIYRLDYVDFTGWKDDDARYRAALSKLLESIVAALDGKIRYRRWKDRLEPWDFASFLGDKRRAFVGRDWLFEQLVTTVDDPEAPRTVLVVGEPGIGKSAIVAELVHRNFGGRVLAYHCCQANVPETLRPGRFVRSVAAMIASRHAAYETLIEQSPYREALLESASDADPESAFEAGVLAALEKAGLPSGGSRMLVIDALDEALQGGDKAGRTIVGLLVGRLQRLPAWLKVVATSRPEAAVLGALAGLKPRYLEAQDPGNLKDLAGYIAGRLSGEPLATRLAESGENAGSVTATLAVLAKGNFLYARQALDAIANETMEIADLGQLPPGLPQQFVWFFDRQFGRTNAWPTIRPLFETLVAAQEPVGERELAAATGLDRKADLARALKAIASYVRTSHEKEPRRELFHRSLIEWLTDPNRNGEPYAIDVSAGHRLLAHGLFDEYHKDRLHPSRYALVHLPLHLAEAARSAAGATRVALQRSLADFALDPIVHEQRVDEPYGVDASCALALATAASGPPLESAPIAFEVALGWQSFRRQRLDARRLFELAREGRLDAFERELQLYPADELWMEAARLVAAWLAIDVNRAAADELRGRARSGLALDERVDAVFEARAPAFEAITAHPIDQEITDIFEHVGGTSERGVNPSMLWDQAAPPPAGTGASVDPEGVRYLAEFHAPVLVGFAQDDPTRGTQRMHDYIALSAANAYRVYRNGSLWQVLRAVAKHRDPEWVRAIAPSIVAAALAGEGRDFTRAVELTLLACRSAIDPRARDGLGAEEDRLRSESAELAAPRGHGDSWGEYRRSLAAIGEARRFVLGENSIDTVVRALGIEKGYAGFQAPASLTLAEALLLCEAPRERIDSALAAARRAAHNVADLVFCARTTARVAALTDDWWARAPLGTVQLSTLIERFGEAPRAAEFTTRHIVGELYLERGVIHVTSHLPEWLRGARTLVALAQVYQWPLADFLAVNAGLEAEVELADGTVVRVPDRRWAPMLAAYFAALVVQAPALHRDEKTRLLLQLVVRAAGEATALDTVLARLLLVARPDTAAELDHYEAVCAKYALQPADERAAFEPLA